MENQGGVCNQWSRGGKITVKLSGWIFLILSWAFILVLMIASFASVLRQKSTNV
jgi:hypothetical protein